ncbi:aminopeptidase P family N-terminal domain-containing protein [Bradyrhizobium sp. Ec3.3]|uniref:aminopeptidase P family N-terminal domain-containing protein n=1 Tax=Bradyrhizobium sp. Ec3.3 TaxID=189753 RepID=UPI0035291155
MERDSIPGLDRQRTARLRQQMAERGMDALLVLNEPNMNYLTGYDGFSDYVPQPRCGWTSCAPGSYR